MLVQGDLRATGDGVSVGGPSLLLGGRLLLLSGAGVSQSVVAVKSINQSINPSIALQLHRSFAANAQCKPRPRRGASGAATRAGLRCGLRVEQGKSAWKGKRFKGRVGWLLSARLVFVGGEVRGQARPLQNKKKLGMHGRGLVSHLAVVGGEAVASGARGRWSPSLVLYSGREEVVGLVSAAVEGDGDATGGLEAVDRSSIVPVSCVLCSASGQQVGAAVQIPDFPRLWGKRVRAGDGCAGAAEGEFVRIGRIRPLIGGCWPGGSQWVGGALTAAARSTICINSTKNGLGHDSLPRSSPTKAYDCRGGVDSTLGPVAALPCSPVWKSCSRNTCSP